MRTPTGTAGVGLLAPPPKGTVRMLGQRIDEWKPCYGCCCNFASLEEPSPPEPCHPALKLGDDGPGRRPRKHTTPGTRKRRLSPLLGRLRAVPAIFENLKRATNPFRCSAVRANSSLDADTCWVDALVCSAEAHTRSVAALASSATGWEGRSGR